MLYKSITSDTCCLSTFSHDLPPTFLVSCSSPLPLPVSDRQSPLWPYRPVNRYEWGYEESASTLNLLTYRLRCATKTFVTSWQQHFHHALAMAMATVTRLAWWQPLGACGWAWQCVSIMTPTHTRTHTGTHSDMGTHISVKRDSTLTRIIH